MSVRLLNLIAAIFVFLAFAGAATGADAHGGHRGHEAPAVAVEKVISAKTAVHAAHEAARVAVAQIAASIQLEPFSGSPASGDDSHPCSHVSCFSCHGTAVVQPAAVLPKFEFGKPPVPARESFWQSAISRPAEQPPKSFA